MYSFCTTLAMSINFLSQNIIARIINKPLIGIEIITAIILTKNLIKCIIFRNFNIHTTTNIVQCEYVVNI